MSDNDFTYINSNPSSPLSSTQHDVPVALQLDEKDDITITLPTEEKDATTLTTPVEQKDTTLLKAPADATAATTVSSEQKNDIIIDATIQKDATTPTDKTDIPRTPDQPGIPPKNPKFFTSQDCTNLCEEVLRLENESKQIADKLKNLLNPSISKLSQGIIDSSLPDILKNSSDLIELSKSISIKLEETKKQFINAMEMRSTVVNSFGALKSSNYFCSMSLSTYKKLTGKNISSKQGDQMLEATSVRMVRIGDGYASYLEDF